MPENVLKIPKLSAFNTWKSAKIPKLSTINAWKCAKNNKTVCDLQLKWQKRPKLITKRSVRKFRNPSQCPRNTQWLTTKHVRLFKTVQQRGCNPRFNYNYSTVRAPTPVKLQLMAPSPQFNYKYGPFSMVQLKLRVSASQSNYNYGPVLQSSSKTTGSPLPKLYYNKELCSFLFICSKRVWYSALLLHSPLIKLYRYWKVGPFEVTFLWIFVFFGPL